MLASDDVPHLAPLIYRKQLYAARVDDRLTVMLPERLETFVVCDSETRPAPPSRDHEADAKRASAMLNLAEHLLKERRYVDH